MGSRRLLVLRSVNRERLVRGPPSFSRDLSQRSTFSAVVPVELTTLRSVPTSSCCATAAHASAASNAGAAGTAGVDRLQLASAMISTVEQAFDARAARVRFEFSMTGSATFSRRYRSSSLHTSRAYPPWTDLGCSNPSTIPQDAYIAKHCACRRLEHHSGHTTRFPTQPLRLTCSNRRNLEGCRQCRSSSGRLRCALSCNYELLPRWDYQPAWVPV